MAAAQYLGFARVKRPKHAREMIEFIEGKIDELTPTQAVLLTAGGVGYGLNISVYTFSAIQNRSETRLYVYEAIREDAHILFGFSDRLERELFTQLISVPGIGGASARMILSSFSPQELQSIVSSGNDTLLKKVKGIGAKTAQRIIVDLKDKIGICGSDAAAADLQPQIQSGKIADEAISAMTALGFQQAASQKVVAAILKEQPDLSVQEVIRQALKRI